MHCAYGTYCCKKCDDCFPASARLSLENGDSVLMNELKVGDKVQTGEIHYFWKDCDEHSSFFTINHS